MEKYLTPIILNIFILLIIPPTCHQYPITTIEFMLISLNNSFFLLLQSVPALNSSHKHEF